VFSAEKLPMNAQERWRLLPNKKTRSHYKKSFGTGNEDALEIL
jgi:hypothetical protein